MSQLSQARLAANRANAQHSTGPKTAEGKAASSQNHYKHGLCSKQLVLPDEDPAALDALRLDLRTEHQPATLTEEILVNEMAEHYWRLKRARVHEIRILNESCSFSLVNLAHRMMVSAERGFHKALKTLREIQKQRGFESQNAVATAQLDGPAEHASAHRPDSEDSPALSGQAALEATLLGFESQNEANKAESPAAQNKPRKIDVATIRRCIANPNTDPAERIFLEEYLHSIGEEIEIPTTSAVA